MPAQWGASSIPQQHQGTTTSPGSATLHRPKPRGRGDGDGGAGPGLGTGICGQGGLSRAWGGKSLQPLKPGAGTLGAAVLGCLGTRAGRGLTPCHSGGPALVTSSRWEKHFQVVFIHLGLFSPVFILQIPLEGVKAAGADLTRCSWVTVG